jgi:hypothetical protein
MSIVRPRALFRIGSTTVVALGAIAMAGCDGTSDDDGGGTAPPIAASDFPARFADGLCGSMAGCCSSNGYSHDYATCRASLEAQMTSLLRLREDQEVRFDSVAGGACVEEYARALEECEPLTGNESCERLFVGLVEPGGRCQSSVECADGEGADQGYCEDGVCTVESSAGDARLAAGDTCSWTCTESGSGSSCSGLPSATTGGGGSCYTNDGLTCDPASQVCVAVPRLGEACTTGSGCEEGAFCEGSTCVPQRTTGPCPTPQACAPSAYCDFEARECVPRLPDGDACQSSDQCLVGHCREGVCRPRIPVDAGICVGLLD